MAASNRSGLGSGSLLRGLVRLALFLGLGFGAGLIFGIVTEEPELLAGHLQGETESYALAAQEHESGSALTAESASETEVNVAPEAKAQVLAATSRGKPAANPSALAQPAVRTGSPAPQEEAKAPRRLVTLEAAKSERMALQNRPRLPLVAAPAPAPAAPKAVVLEDAWAIQVGAFSDPSTAEGLVQSLGQKNYHAEMIPADRQNEKWRVRIQPVAGRAKAEAVAERLKRNERLPTWLIPFEGRERP